MRIMFFPLAPSTAGVRFESEKASSYNCTTDCFLYSVHCLADFVKGGKNTFQTETRVNVVTQRVVQLMCTCERVSDQYAVWRTAT